MGKGSIFSIGDCFVGRASLHERAGGSIEKSPQFPVFLHMEFISDW